MLYILLCFDEAMEKISAQKNISPNRTRPMVAQVPTTSTDIM